MKSFTVGTLVLCGVLSACPRARAEDRLRPWTPAVSVAMRHFLINQRSPGMLMVVEGEPIQWSPDGRYFFFVSYRGDIATDTVEYALHVYSTDSVRRALTRGRLKMSAPAPAATITHRSANPLYGGIEDARWDVTGRAIRYFGMTDDGRRSGFRLDSLTGREEDITPQARAVRSFDYRGGGAAYIDRFSNGVDRLRYPMEPVPLDESGAIQPRNFFRDAERKAVSYRGRSMALEGEASEINRFWIAPDGRSAIVNAIEQSGQTGRARFGLINLDPAAGPEGLRILARFSSVKRPRISSGGRIVAPTAVWSADASHAVLVGAAHGESDSVPQISSYAVASGEWQVLEPLWSVKSDGSLDRWVASVDESADGEELIVRYGDSTSGTRYALSNGRWFAHAITNAAGSKTSASSFRDISVVLRQSSNDEPVVIASLQGRELALTAPDPALKGVWRARIQDFTWREVDGTVKTGGLMLPRDFVPGKRIPLAIQTYLYRPGYFRPDGYNTSSDWAQSLLARGIAVAQIDTVYEFLEASRSLAGRTDPAAQASREGERLISRVEAVVQELAREGKVDPNRVSLSGFSRAGYETLYAVTHPRTLRLAAAAAIDSFRGSFQEYLLVAGQGSPVTDFMPIDGGHFWDDKATWLQNDTLFNMDRVATPLLYTQHGNLELDEVVRDFAAYDELAMQFIGAFQLSKRPLEFLIFPGGEHNLQRPLQRLAMGESMTEWLAFWLNGETPTDPERAKRWLVLREQQQAILDGLKAKGQAVAPLPPLTPAKVH